MDSKSFLFIPSPLLLLLLHWCYLIFYVDAFRASPSGPLLSLQPNGIGLSGNSLPVQNVSYRSAEAERGCKLRGLYDNGRRSCLWAVGRVPLIGGNWKSQGTVESVRELVDLYNRNVTGDTSNQSVEVVVAPPSIHLGYVKDHLNSQWQLAAQNVALHKGYGAFTGEQSAEMIRDFGITWTLTGHSERRKGFGAPGETNEIVASKTKVAVDQGLKTIVCIGEDLADRESNMTMDVINAQLGAIKKVLSPFHWSKVVVAYEPVWAIGTGKTATPEMAQETHKAIRKWIADNVSASVASTTRIIYGGSVKGNNAEELSQCPDIDGFLVGGASLNKEFIAIIRATQLTAEGTVTPSAL